MTRLKDLGVSIVPIVDTDKLGLQRVRASFELSQDIRDQRSILGSLYEKAGLKFYSRCLVTQEYECEFMIPKGSLYQFNKLIRALEEMKLIKNVTCRPILWKSFTMMKTKYFDYETGEWDIDFSRLVSDPSERVYTLSDEDTKLDYTDLLIIKSLELDPWMKVVDLAKRINLPVGDISYHLNKHVFGNKMISYFRLRWVGTKEAWSKHTIIAQTFVFEGLSEELARHAMSIMTATPFSWNHSLAEDGTYTAELLIPVSHFPETVAYISDRLRPLGMKPRMQYMDWSCTTNFTIPYRMFEPQKRWSLNAERALGYVLQMISQLEKL